MAMISCPNCRKPVSDKAEKCPHCGFELTPIASNFCPECGNSILEGAVICPTCGYPIDNSPQKVEVTRVKISKKSIIIVLSIVIVLAVAIISGLAIRNYIVDQKTEEERIAYQETLDATSAAILLQGYSAESCGSLIHDVWFNTIYEEDDYITDDYTKNSYGRFYDDFNDALSVLFSDEDFLDQIDSLKSGQDAINSFMKELSSPPEGFENAHEAILELYDAYTALVNLAISPSGNLQSYTENFNEADSNFANCYKALQIYITD